MMADQERLPLLFAIILCAGVSCWFYINLEMNIDYSWHRQLIDQKSGGGKRHPSELLQLAKIINHTSEYIEATNAEERLYDLRYNLDFVHPFSIEQHYSYADEKLVSGWPVANQKLCGAQLDWILNQLAKHPDYTFLRGQLGLELTSLMDSFGGPGANTYAGIVSWLGSYERCLSTSLDGGNIKTRYCEARMKPKWWPSDDDDVVLMSPPTRIRLGMCLPETCDTLSLEHHRSAIERLAKLRLPEPYKSGLDLKDLFCLPDERSPIRQLPPSGRIFLAVVGSWLVLVVAGTIAYERHARRQEEKHNKTKRPAAIDSLGDHQNKTATISTLKTTESEQGSNALASTSLRLELAGALSLRCSLNAFMSNPFRIRHQLGQQLAPRLDLNCLDFLKTFMTMVIIYCHSFFLTSTFARNSSKKIDLNLDYRNLLVISFALSVDTFFVIFGLLVTYTLMCKLSTNQLANPSVWLAVNLDKFLRIVSIFWLVYFYSRTVSPYTGAGPWWDYGVDKSTLKGACLHESWLKAVPYFGKTDYDGLPPVPSCNLVSWFATSYLQLLLILPMLTYTLCKLPTHMLRFALTGFLVLASAFNLGARLYAQTTITTEGFTLYGTFLMTLMEKFESLGHISTLGRLRSAAIGCLVGYLLRQYELGKISRWPKWLSGKWTLWLTIVGHVVVIVFPLYNRWSYLRTQRVATLEEVVIANVAVQILWPTINATLILLLTTTYRHLPVVRFFSHSFWSSFNMLGFCIYLIHWEILWVLVSGYEQAAPYGHFNEILRLGALGAILSVILSFFIHLLVEAPLSRLITILMQALFSGGRGKKGSQHKQLSADNSATAATTTKTKEFDQLAQDTRQKQQLLKHKLL